ncbi:MAG: nucleotidyltransferase [Gammaproteobacteria bacterium]|nr:nucleotidyltransferase [Gammaproteobacteria bacterium]MYF38898.1 nucleotidyltransferase [Gammaproteobacteria bacterium]
MGIQTHFDKFHNKIKLGREDDAYKKARDRDDSIKKDVASAFQSAGYPVVKDFIQGSLKTHTGIIPISGDYDIDRALVIEDDVAPENPVTPKKKTLEVLEERGFKNAKIKKPCVTADYTGDNVHIDFIIYKLSGDQHYLAVGKGSSDEKNREWAATDPCGLTDWINDDSLFGVDDRKEVLAQFRRLVRYIKRWRDVQFSESVASKVYSIGLTVLVKEQLQYSFSTEGARQDLQALINTVGAILDSNYFTEEETGKYRVCVDLPKEPWRNIFDGSSLDTGTQIYNKLSRLKEQLIKAEGLSDEREQCKILNDLFGKDFEIPEPPKGGSKSEKAKYSSAGIVTASVGA